MITTSTTNSASEGNININTNTKEVTYNVKNVIVDKPKIGDVVYTSSLTTGYSVSNGIITADKIFVSGNTATTTAPTGYPICLGVVYGFENGYAKIMAPVSTSKKFSENATNDFATNNVAAAGILDNATVKTTLPYGLTNDYIGGGSIRVRNGSTMTYCAMNVARIKATLASSTATSETSGRLTPNSSYYGNNKAMNETNFNQDSLAVAMYGTYDNYIKGMLPVSNGKDSPFSSKRHLGYRNTRYLAIGLGSEKGSTTNLISNDTYYHPAANYCYFYDPSTKAEGATTHYGYYLHDMVDLRQIMYDDVLNKVNPSITKIGGNTQSNSASCWSSLRYSPTLAWLFSDLGYSNYSYFRISYVVRAVALLKI